MNRNTRRVGPSFLLLLVISLLCYYPATVSTGEQLERKNLSGRVVDGKGQPIGDARVDLWMYWIDFDEEEHSVDIANTLTAESGRFEIAEIQEYQRKPETVFQQYVIVASKAGYSFGGGTFPFAKAPRVIEIILKQPTALSGMVTDTDGKPIADALVTGQAVVGPAKPLGSGYTCVVFPHLQRGFVATATDGNGQFTLSNLPANSDVHLAARKKGFVGKLGATRASVDGENPTIVLHRAARIEGKVIDKKSGKMRTNVVLRIKGQGFYDARPRAGYDADGRFFFDNLPPGKHDIYLDECRDNLTFTASPITIKVDEGKTVNNALVELVEGGIITGTVLYNSGLPAAKVKVEDFQGFSPHAYVTTGADGTYRFRLMPGMHEILCHAVRSLITINVESGVTLRGIDLRGRQGQKDPERSWDSH